VRDGKFAGVFERIAGREGGLCLNDGLFMPRKDQVKRNGETIKLEPVDYRPQEPDHIESALAAFVRSIRHDEPVICDVTEGRNATYTGLLVREAVEQGRRVEMKELM
jgi:predicted dehydrogenase